MSNFFFVFCNLPLLKVSTIFKFYLIEEKNLESDMKVSLSTVRMWLSLDLNKVFHKDDLSSIQFIKLAEINYKKKLQ